MEIDTINKTTIDRDRAIQELDKIIELTEAINTNVSDLERRRMNYFLLILPFVFTLSLVLFQFGNKLATSDNSQFLLVDKLSFFILGLMPILGIAYSIKATININKEISREQSILDELYDTVDGAFRVNMSTMSPFESVYYRMRLSRLKYH